LLVALLPQDATRLIQAQQTATSHPSLPSGTLEISTAEIATAVVIDTLRFTTSACQALQAGAHAVWVAASVEQAQALAQQLTQQPAGPSTARPLLCGERHCHRIAGFDLGNSPFEYTQQTVQDRDLVFTTTNGTLAIDAVDQLPHIVLAALVNRAAMCQHLLQCTAGDVVIVCAGTDGQVTWEDVLTAGALVDYLLKSTAFELGDDTSRLAAAAWRETAYKALSSSQLRIDLLRALSQALGGRNLLVAGYERDVSFAAQLDTLDAVPRNSPSQPRCFTL
jgi:2-phosphosulfolactate phosphatase